MPPIRKENRAYKKGAAYKDSRKFIIVCEGKREANYFNYFHDKYKKLVVKVIEPTEDFDGHSAPRKLVERAGQYMIDQEWDESLDDELWFIVDTDRWERQLHELSNFCDSQKNWFLANSNPCFEVWLFYHFDCTKILEPIPQNVKRILNEQKRGGYKLEKYVTQIESAIQCSSEMDNQPKQRIAELGITKVYQLSIKILELIPRINGTLNL